MSGDWWPLAKALLDEALVAFHAAGPSICGREVPVNWLIVVGCVWL